MYNLDPYDPPPYFPTRPHYPPGADYIVSPTGAPSKKNCLKPFQASCFIIFHKISFSYNLDPPPPTVDYSDYSGGPEGCAGCFQPAEVNQEIVDFAVSQFSRIDKNCFNIGVENFQQAVGLYVEVR